MFAVEFTAKKVMWKAESLGRASVAYADGLLYVHGWNGDVALVEATPEMANSLLWLSGSINRRGSIWRLYIRDLGTLWAYDSKR